MNKARIRGQCLGSTSKNGITLCTHALVQICDLADGGQVLLGPKTYQRCVLLFWSVWAHWYEWLLLCSVKGLVAWVSPSWLVHCSKKWCEHKCEQVLSMAMINAGGWAQRVRKWWFVWELIQPIYVAGSTSAALKPLECHQITIRLRSSGTAK